MTDGGRRWTPEHRYAKSNEICCENHDALLMMVMVVAMIMVMIIMV